ncbi:SDR family oxidoreductase [Abyssibius alkaniclasticus]|uniref:SDR family NAD(P)-dependent oxidoreductase n=1 Tax=Abyssibius alkaniclasticus TaxID=2881234 RepID=UPI002364044F|nr:SDR family oxidoreductase [Abyssibius alkaniclasticus]UPH70938.1 SDR family oxidoreductase [Abyssibius alkaniclasticus]
MKEQTKLALVTGASRGLGYAMALELGKRGYHIMALARSQGGLEELADALDAIGAPSTLVPLDLSDDMGVQRMCLAIHERWGKLDLLVHCAVHAAPLSPVSHVGEKDLDRSIAVNIRATQRLMGMAESLVRAASGTMVYFRDDMGGHKFQSTYGMSKAAQAALVETQIAESAEIGPRVLHLSPKPMATATRARFYPGEDRGKLASPADEAARLMAEILP